MTYDEAIKKLKAEKAKENFMVVSIDALLVLPHKDGVALLQALANAEKLPRYFSDGKRIDPLDADDISTRFLSHQEYELCKIAALLNISVDELKKIQKEGAAAS